jgi:hypothetical protein
MSTLSHWLPPPPTQADRTLIAADPRLTTAEAHLSPHRYSSESVCQEIPHQVPKSATGVDRRQSCAELQRHHNRRLLLSGPVINPRCIDIHLDPHRIGKRNLGAVCAHYQVRRDQQLADEITAAEQAVSAAHGELARLARDTNLAARDYARREETLRRSEQDLNSIRATLDQARAALGAQFPDEGWWRDRSRRDLAALWTDPEWNRARTEVFLAALGLHKAFLQHVPTHADASEPACRYGYPGRDAPRDLPEGTALAA